MDLKENKELIKELEIIESRLHGINNNQESIELVYSSNTRIFKETFPNKDLYKEINKMVKDYYLNRKSEIEHLISNNLK